uniref:hypothetical protein n=1 Tax=Thaumasiovibrio occultus TaxID=1891184 RepID=UPI000B35EC07|nr:hypothetical protein [Thaumasiovibrio occultus]
MYLEVHSARDVALDSLKFRLFISSFVGFTLFVFTYYKYAVGLTEGELFHMRILWTVCSLSFLIYMFNAFKFLTSAIKEGGDWIFEVSNGVVKIDVPLPGHNENLRIPVENISCMRKVVIEIDSTDHKYWYIGCVDGKDIDINYQQVPFDYRAISEYLLANYGVECQTENR